MATTKADITLQSSASNSAGGTTTGSGVSLATGYGAIVSVKVTNGATGPTVGCLASIQISYDGTNWKEFWQARAGVDNSGVYEWPVQIPAAVQEVRSVFDENTGQAVTIEALGSHITAI